MNRMMKKVVFFSLALSIGIFVSSFFKPNLDKQTIIHQIKSESKTTNFNSSTLRKCDTYKGYLNDLIKNQAELKNWIVENKDIPKNELKKKSEEIEELKTKIKNLKSLKDYYERNPEAESRITNLLYKQTCYEF